jgi:hypothetical protein
MPDPIQGRTWAYFEYTPITVPWAKVSYLHEV